MAMPNISILIGSGKGLIWLPTNAAKAYTVDTMKKARKKIETLVNFFTSAPSIFSAYELSNLLIDLMKNESVVTLGLTCEYKQNRCQNEMQDGHRWYIQKNI